MGKCSGWIPNYVPTAPKAPCSCHPPASWIISDPKPRAGSSQAWLKARPVAGNIELGRSVCRAGQAQAVARENRAKIETSMRAVRQKSLEKLRQENRLSSEVKLGPGGIRTIEFFVQYLQIQHGQAMPELDLGQHPGGHGAFVPLSAPKP